MIAYIIGSLRNPDVPKVGIALREKNIEVFDDWFAGGEKADEEWMKYEKSRGRTYAEALKGYAAQHTFGYDLSHLNRADIGILVAPAGKSAHLELGYMIGQGKPGFIYMPDEPERWDVMVLFATGLATTLDELITFATNTDCTFRRRNLDGVARTKFQEYAVVLQGGTDGGL